MSAAPAYLQKLRKKFKTSSDAAIEMLCARSKQLQEGTGHDENHHRRAAMRLMFPHRIEHEWRVRMIESWTFAKSRGIQELGWIGSAMSNKTGTMADCLVELWMEDPENTTVLVMSPTKDATEGRLWAEIVSSFTKAKAKHNDLPGELIRSQGVIRFNDTNKRGLIQVVSSSDHGTIIGGNNENVSSGNFIVACDELPNVPNNAQEIRDALPNLKMRPSFTFWYSGNFAEEFDGMGIIARPVDGYESLDVETSEVWFTGALRNGVVFRFDGMRSPNVIAQKDIYPFLTRWAVVKEYIAAGQTNTAEFYRWIRSFPLTGMDSKTVTNRIRMRKGGAFLQIDLPRADAIDGAMFDTGFGGDPAILQPVRLGWERLESGKRRRVLEIVGPPLTVPVHVHGNAREDAEDVNRQLVAWCQKFCEERGIKPRNFWYDGSMRAGIVQEFARWSIECVAIDFGGQPTSRTMCEGSTRSWLEEVSNFVSELWFAANLCFQAGIIRGLTEAHPAVAQFCTRQWRWRGNKKQVEPKDEYKLRAQAGSPNEADAIVIGIEWARRNGLVISVDPKGGLLPSLRELLDRTEDEWRKQMLLGLPMPGVRGALVGQSLSQPLPRHLS